MRASLATGVKVMAVGLAFIEMSGLGSASGSPESLSYYAGPLHLNYLDGSVFAMRQLLILLSR